MTESGRISGGFDMIFFGIVNNDGILIGNTADGAAIGTVEEMTRLYGAKTLPVAVKEPETVVGTGDNKALVSFQFEPADLPDGILQLAARDLVFEGLIQGTSTYVLQQQRFGVLQPGNTEPPTMCLLLLRRAKTWSKNAKGGGAWEVMMVPSCNITPLGAEWTERAVNPYSYKITVNKAGHLLWGETIASTNLGTDSAPLIPVDSDNPIHAVAAQGDGAATAFTVSYTPVSSSRMLVFVDRVLKTLTTHYTVTGKTITFLSAPRSGGKIVIWYETTQTEMV